MSSASRRSGNILLHVAGVLALLMAAVVCFRHLPDITTSRLPGGAGGADTYRVRVEFSDVLDLVPNASVRLADVPVGRVTAIRVGEAPSGRPVAVVDIAVANRYQLPADTTAAIRNTSLLGEKYVALTVPDGSSTDAGSLARTHRIGLDRTTQDVEVEQLLGSFGALLNGGGLQQMSVITREFAHGLKGHEKSTRELLGDLDQIVRTLNEGHQQIITAIDGAQRLSSVLAAQGHVIGNAIAALDPATGVLAREQRMLTRALRSLQRLNDVATPLIEATTPHTVADFRALGRVTRELGKVADLLPRTLTTLLTYPFGDSAVRAFSNAYAGSAGQIDIDVAQLLSQVVPTLPGTSQPAARPETADNLPQGSLSPTSPPVPSLAPADQPTGGIGNLLGTLLGRDRTGP